MVEPVGVALDEPVGVALDESVGVAVGSTTWSAGLTKFTRTEPSSLATPCITSPPPRKAAPSTAATPACFIFRISGPPCLARGQRLVRGI